jgi:hypothetical protein
MSGGDPLFDRYKPVRNLIRRYEPLSLVRQFIGALHEVHHRGVDVMVHYQPWNLFLAIKWTLLEQNAAAHRQREATLNDAHKVLNLIHSLEGAVPMPKEITSIALFVRRIAFQQFWLGSVDGAAIARQEILFGALPVNHTFSREFEAATGLTIPVFLDLAFGLLATLLGKNPPQPLLRAHFANFGGFPPSAVDTFFRLVSRSPQELKTWLNEAERPLIEDQLLLPTPLLLAPYLRLTDRHFCYFPPLAYRFVEQFIYRTLRDSDPEKFMQRFGPMFEHYVGDCLREAGVILRTEADLQEKLPGDGKCVDFGIVEDDSNVLIDAKGVEMSSLGRVTWSAEEVFKAAKGSAVKAIVQGMETAQRMERAAEGEFSWGRREHFLLIVTFEPLCLGSGRDLGTTLGSSFTDSLCHKFGAKWPFPLENVFCLSIREFGDLLEHCRAKSAPLINILRHVRTADANAKTKRFNIGQHLDSLAEPGPKLPMLSAALDRIQERCMKRIQQPKK